MVPRSPSVATAINRMAAVAAAKSAPSLRAEGAEGAWPLRICSARSSAMATVRPERMSRVPTRSSQKGRCVVSPGARVDGVEIDENPIPPDGLQPWRYNHHPKRPSTPGRSRLSSAPLRRVKRADAPESRAISLASWCGARRSPGPHRTSWEFGWPS